MKTIINKWTVLMLVGVVLGSCTKHTEYDDTSFEAVEHLLYPSDGDKVDLIDQGDAKVYFEWEASRVGTPTYMVVFRDARGNEIERRLSDDDGRKATLKLLYSELNRIAGDAGIEPDATGDLYWTVCAALGGAEKLSPDEAHRLSVTRYASIDAPYRLYVTGAGSEFTDDPAQVRELRNLGDGRFEIYTKFSGEFRFINRNEAGNKRTFGVSETGRLVEASDATGTGDGIYHVTVDFNTGTVSMAKIESVKYHYCWTPDPDAEMTYAGDGVWKYDIEWTGGDSRYRFDVVIDGVGYIWGYSEKDMNGGDVPTALTGPTYTLSMREKGDINPYDYGFKFYAALENVPCTIVLDCSPSVEAYCHGFEFAFEPVAKAVGLSTPAADASVELNAVPGSSETFSWSLSEEISAAEKQLTTHTLIFYADAARSQEVARVSAGSSSSVAVSDMDLDAYARLAGIGSGARGELYWAVESELIGTTASSDLRKLIVTRVKGIPDMVYITGPASEFGSGFQHFKMLEAGKFEIYTKLTAGSYSITDSERSDARSFSVAGGKLEESTSANTSDEEAIYRITLDFIAGTSRFEKITDVQYQFKMTRYVVELPYRGNGIWGENNFSATNGGDDTRYYLYMSFDGVPMRLGNSQADYAAADPESFSMEGDSNFYVYLMEEPSNEWNYYFKFPRSYRKTQKAISLKLNMSSDVEHYYNYVTDQTIF